MFNRKMLFSLFNTGFKSYSSKIIYVNNCRGDIYNYISSPNHLLIPLLKKSNFSTKISDNNVSFEELQEITTKNDVLLIDVREPSELQETGTIPGSINIPLGDVENVFKRWSEEEFLKKFGRNKPKHDFPIVFSCLLGKRSASAQNKIQQLGYLNVRNYLGGWSEWSEKIKN